MATIRLVTMRFDLSDPVDAETYAQLKHTGERAGRPQLRRQAEYLLSVLLGTRQFTGTRNAGLDQWPVFADSGNPLDALEARLAAISQGLDRVQLMLDHPTKKRPCLRLVPLNQQPSSHVVRVTETERPTDNISA